MIITGANSISQVLMVNQTLLEFHMEGNQIGDDGIMAIKASLNNSSITLLDVIGCGISVVGARLIMKSVVDNAVCENVLIEYYDDDEVKRMRSILDDRRRQDARILYDDEDSMASKDDDYFEEKLLEVYSYAINRILLPW